jgi:hypothetical protein
MESSDGGVVALEGVDGDHVELDAGDEGVMAPGGPQPGGAGRWAGRDGPRGAVGDGDGPTPVMQMVAAA